LKTTAVGGDLGGDKRKGPVKLRERPEGDGGGADGGLNRRRVSAVIT